MAMESGEFGEEGDCHTFVLGGAEVDRMAIRVGGRSGFGRYPGSGQPLFYLVEGGSCHVSSLQRGEGVPDGRPVERWAGDGEGESPLQGRGGA